MIKQEYIDKLNAIYLHFGPEAQENKWREEVEELKSEFAIIHFFPKSENLENLIDEKADNIVMALQHFLNDELVRNKVYEKIDRTIARIQDKYYE